MKEIDDLRRNIIEITGGKDEDGNYVGAEDYDKVMNLTLGSGDSKSGKAYQLERLLNDYAEKMSSFDSTLQIESLALGASEIEQFKNLEKHQNKDFAQLNFDHTPTVAALAILSHLQSEVVRTETKVLEVLAAKIGLVDVPFDRIVALVSPESRSIVAGSPYRAKVTIAASSSTTSPVMEASIGDLKVNEFGEGSLEFTPTITDFGDQNKIKKIWKGSITVPTPRGDTTLYIEEEYYIQKPTIQVSSAAIQALYFNCGNKLSVQVPELGINYDPSFQVDGGELILNEKKGFVTILPKKAKVELTVKNKGFLIGKEKFRVKAIPKPTIKLTYRGKELDYKNGDRLPRRIKALAISDPDFKEFLPRDARFRITQWQVSLVRNNRAIDVIKATSNDISLNAFEEARKGDYLLFEIFKVERLNYKNERENVKMNLPMYFSFPITL
jgi:gliding motility-associated protein GldM